MISNFLSDIKSRNLTLYRFGWLNLAAFGAGLVLFFTDPTVVTGINAWIKPMKFSLSITIYVWTFAWLLHHINSAKHKKIITWGVVVCMLVENALIYMQAARGVKSHFNISSSFDGMVFSTMGFFIMVNSFLILYTIILFFTSRVRMDQPWLWAWRAGLIFFFFGGLSGGIMVVLLHHTVGAQDGGPGLPFLNWSTLFGDLRSPHFITLHGLQAVPLLTWLAARLMRSTSGSIVAIISMLFLALCIWLHWLALSGIPLIHSS